MGRSAQKRAPRFVRTRRPLGSCLMDTRAAYFSSELEAFLDVRSKRRVRWSLSRRACAIMRQAALHQAGRSYHPAGDYIARLGGHEVVVALNNDKAAECNAQR